MSLSVRLDGVGKSYGVRDALNSISAGFPAGTISAVIGPNGGGKTTLLRIIACLEAPDRGRVTYSGNGGVVPAGLGLMRRMTCVSQRPLLFDTTLYENIAYGLKARKLSPGEIKARVDEAMEEGGLSGLARARAVTLSGGETQRAALVRAFALRPDLILLDEPTASLDPDGAALMEGLIRRINSEYGTTVVMTTHNLFQARRLAGRVFFLYGGELVEEANVGTFFEAPQKDLTRKFLTGEVVY